MKRNSNLIMPIVFFGLLFFFLNIAAPVLMSFTDNKVSVLDSLAFAEEEEEGEGEGEEASEVDEMAYLYDIGKNANAIKGTWEVNKQEYIKNNSLEKLKESGGVDSKGNLIFKEGKSFTFPKIGNRKAAWLLAQIHVLFASFVLGCPMFVIMMEIFGAEKTPGVKRASIIAAGMTGMVVGVIFGAVGEVIIGIHGAEHGCIAGGGIAAVVTGLMVLFGIIGKEGGAKKGAIVGAIIGGIVGAVETHMSVGGIILGAIAGIIGGLTSPAMMNSAPDEKFERLSHEIVKVIGMCYSFTALSGGFFFLILVVLYGDFIQFLFQGFPMLTTVIYPLLFVLETVVLYTYVYSWDNLNKEGKKGTHIFIGLILNIMGLSLLFVMDSPASFMLTPTKPVADLAIMTESQWFFNYSWMPLNFHRLVGNITFGGYMVGLISAYMFLWSDKSEDREFYDWQGYMGNVIGVAAMIPLMAMGYVYIKEVYMYDAAIGMYIMSDRLSMFMIVQALLILSLFLASNLYMWVSMRRIEGAERFFPYMKFMFALLIICACVWFTPKRYYPTMMPEGAIKALSPEGIADLELNGPLGVLGVMVSKNSASFALGLITLINYIFYTIAGNTGKTAWGKVNPLSQYVLIFIAFVDIWLMSWMGVIREMARKSNHIFKVFKDVNVDKYTLTLAESGKFNTMIVWIFFALMTFIIWLALRYQKKHKAH